MDTLSLLFISVIAITLIGYGIFCFQERKRKHTH